MASCSKQSISLFHRNSAGSKTNQVCGSGMTGSQLQSERFNNSLSGQLSRPLTYFDSQLRFLLPRAWGDRRSEVKEEGRLSLNQSV